MASILGSMGPIPFRLTREGSMDVDSSRERKKSVNEFLAKHPDLTLCLDSFLNLLLTPKEKKG